MTKEQTLLEEREKDKRLPFRLGVFLYPNHLPDSQSDDSMVFFREIKLFIP